METTKINNAFRVLFRTIIEPVADKNFEHYILHRFMCRAYLLMQILIGKKIMDYQYWEFYCTNDTMYGKQLYSHELLNFIKLYLPSRVRVEGKLTPAAQEAVNELEELTKDVEEDVLNRACMITFKLAQYGFPDSRYVVDSTLDLLHGKNVTELSETVKLVGKILKNPSFSHLNKNYKFLLNKKIKNVEKRIIDEAAFCDVMKEFAYTEN